MDIKIHSLTTLLCTFLAILCIALFSMPSLGFASVQKADIVLGRTVEERGLAVSQCPNVEAAHVILADSNGTVYFERDADSPANIASITKVVTAVTALDYAPLDTTIFVSDYASSIGESTAALLAGDTLTLEEALKALLIPSGNDSAQAIAESIGSLMLEADGLDSGDPDACEQRFVQAMNDKAAQIGMANSHWTNPHGLDDGEFTSDQHSTARDVSKLSAYAMKNDLLRSITSQDIGSCHVIRDGSPLDLQLETTDELLGVYEGALGIKTGFTDSAGNCFAGACVRDGVELYSVVLNSADEFQRFTDTEELWNWVYDHMIDFPLCSTPRTAVNQAGEEVPLVADVANETWIEQTVQATFADPNATARIFDLSGNISQEVEYATVHGDVHAGDILGTVTFLQRNEPIASVDLVAIRDVPAPNFFEGIGVWWDKLIGSFHGDDRVAESKLYNQPPLLNEKGA